MYAFKVSAYNEDYMKVDNQDKYLSYLMTETQNIILLEKINLLSIEFNKALTPPVSASTPITKEIASTGTAKVQLTPSMDKEILKLPQPKGTHTVIIVIKSDQH